MHPPSSLLLFHHAASWDSSHYLTTTSASYRSDRTLQKAKREVIVFRIGLHFLNINTYNPNEHVY